MPVIKQDPIWECELCGNRQNEAAVKTPAWIKFPLYIDDDVDLDADDKTICWHCCNAIYQAMSKKGLRLFDTGEE